MVLVFDYKSFVAGRPGDVDMEDGGVLLGAVGRIDSLSVTSLRSAKKFRWTRDPNH